MRLQARLALGLCSMALAVPVSVLAAPPDDGAPASEVVSATPPPHPHKGLFGWRHCSICARARAKARYGIDVPPPPSLTSASGLHEHAGAGDAVMVAPGQEQIAGATRVPCPTCQGGVVMEGPSSGMVMTGPSTNMDHGAPGYAVVGGPGGMADPNAPGYAVVGGSPGMGADPAPIGVARNSGVPGFDPRMAAAGRRPGSSPYDPAVLPSSLPPGQTAVSGPGHDRPHIISHMIGLPKLGRYQRDQADKERQRHAAIAYDESKAPVTELPASMVYGKNSH